MADRPVRSYIATIAASVRIKGGSELTSHQHQKALGERARTLRAAELGGGAAK
jgi:hypothetical protein